MSGNIRLEIRRTLQRHHFPKHAIPHCERLIVRAIRQSRIYRKKLPSVYWSSIANSFVPYQKLPKGRSRKEMRIRFLIMHALFRAWRFAFQEEPIINNRGSNPRPFTLFAEDVFIGDQIANTEDNLEHYRSYIRRLLRIESRRKTIISTYI